MSDRKHRRADRTDYGPMDQPSRIHGKPHRRGYRRKKNRRRDNRTVGFYDQFDSIDAFRPDPGYSTLPHRAKRRMDAEAQYGLTSAKHRYRRDGSDHYAQDMATIDLIGQHNHTYKRMFDLYYM